MPGEFITLNQVSENIVGDLACIFVNVHWVSAATVSLRFNLEQ
jgi:hypothetical protein